MSWIRERLRNFSNRVAIFENDRRSTFADLLERVELIANKLPQKPGQIIEIAQNTTLEGLAELLAIADSGHLALPLPGDLTEGERTNMRAIVRDSSLCREFTGSGLILFSSGTSGEPKGMLHDLNAFLNRYSTLPERRDRCLLLLLLDHIGGLDSALRCILAGSTLVVPNARSPEAAGRAIQTHQVNILPASPTFLNLILLANIDKQFDLSSIEVIAYGAEPMPEGLLKRLQATFPKARLLQKFGTSETGAIKTRSPENLSLFFSIEESDTQWRVVDGELWLKAPSRIIGYLNADNSSLEGDGWYRTGDLIEAAEDGSLRIIGRRTSILNVGGQKVHPNEIADVLMEIPGILSAEVFGSPHPITGIEICAKLVLEKTASEQDPLYWKRMIRQFCRGRLAPWKLPSRVTIASSLNVTRRLKNAGG